MSDGQLTSAGWLEKQDLTGALDYLRRRGFTAFGCVGMSQGGATIALAAPQLRDVKWAILESVYPTLEAALDQRFRRAFHLPVRVAGAAFLPLAERRIGTSLSSISPVSTIGHAAFPVFIIGGGRDRETPADQTMSLYAAAHEPKQLWLVPDAAHVDLYGFNPPEYERRVLDFINRFSPDGGSPNVEPIVP